MSETVDSRVVEMRFDNSQFESNVKTSMSTLERLKQSLNLSGAAKELENVSAEGNKFNLNGMGSAIETVHAKFSALEVMGVTALANITNSAVNAGKNIVSALTIDPVKSGFQEYETQINAVQTILANTSSKGTTLDQVNDALDELNKYADMTIYNFTEMTRNIGTFTAAGVDLDTSVNAIKGIANLAAVSGSNSQQASTAMYQLSQALAAGTVKLQDWNSVVNAGMGGQVFQDSLKETARVHGIVIDQMIEEEGSFRETLSKGWLSSEILTETLSKFTMAAEEGTAEWEEYKKSLKEKGYTEEQANEILKMANTATDAATKVKTFTQLWDVLKEAAQSGWTQTWELIIGDFEGAKNLFTPLSDTLTGFINRMSDARNTLLEGALSSPFAKLAEKISKVTGATEKMSEATKDYGDIVNRVIGGEFGNGQSRWDKLTEAGYDWAKVQNLVNEQLGSSKRYTEQLAEVQDKANESQALTIEQLIQKSDAQLENIGFTKDEVEGLRDLEKQSKKTGIPIDKLIENIDQLSGRTLLINSFKNAGSGLVGVFTAMKNAWVEIFPPMTSEQLYNIIAGLHKLSTYLRLTDAETGELTETAQKLQRTFKGLFAIIGIITDITGGGLKIAFKAVSSVLGYFHMDILDVTASIGDALVAFREAINVNKLLDKAVKNIIPLLTSFADGVRYLYDAFMNLPIVQKIVRGIQNQLYNLKNMNFKEIGKNIIDGLINGLGDGAEKTVDAIIELGKSIISGICEVLGIHSPSTKFFEIGENIVQGLVNGISSGINKVIAATGKLGEIIIQVFEKVQWDKMNDGLEAALTRFKRLLGNFDFKKLLAVIPIGVVLIFAKKIYDVADVLAKGISSINGVIGGLAKIESQFAEVLKNIALNIKADAIQKIAISLAILVGSLVLLTRVDTEKLIPAVTVVLILSFVLGALAFAVSQMSKASMSLDKKQGLKINGLALNIVAIGAALLLLSKAMANFASIDSSGFGQAVIAIMLFVGAIITIIGVFAISDKFLSTANISSLNGLLLSVSISMLLMVGVCKLASKLSVQEMQKGGAFAFAFLVFIGALRVISTIGNGQQIAKLSGLLLSVSISLMLMVGVCKLAGKLSTYEMKNGAIVAGAFLVFIGILRMVATIGGGKQIAKLSGLLLSVSISLMLMVGVCKLAGKLNQNELSRGATFAIAFLVFIGVLRVIATIGNDQQIAKMGATILALSIALGIMAGVAVLLSMMPVDGLIKGVAAVVFLGLIMSLMASATKGANDCHKNLVVMAVTIAVMAGAVAALSMIDGKKLAVAVGALSMLMAMFAVVEACSKFATGSVGTLMVMTVAITVLGGLLYLLSGLPIESLLGATAALSILLLSLSVSFAIVGSTSAMAASAIPALAAMVGAVAILAVILGIMAALDVQPSLETSLALSVLLLAMSAACLILSAVGASAPAALAGAAALDGVILVIAGLMAGIGALVTYIPSLEEFLDKGISVLEKIGYGIGSFVGNIIGGLGAGATAGLPEIGANLAAFMESFNGIDPSMLDAVKSLAEAILVLTAADVLNGLTSFITGGSSLSDFAEQLKPFGEGMQEYATAVSGLDETAIQAIQNSVTATDALVGLAEKIPNSGGLLGLLAGNNDIGDFGAQLVSFGEGLVDYSEVVADINIEGITKASEAVKQISNTTIPEIQSSGASMIQALGRGIQSEQYRLDGIISGVFEAILKNMANKHSTFYEEGSTAIVKFVDGINANQNTAKSSFESLLDSAVTIIKQFRPEFYSAGSFVGDGLVAGINSKQTEVYNAGYALGQMAVQGEKDGQQSHSPSKLTIQSGKWLGEGLAIGITKMRDKVYDAGHKMGNDAVDSISSSISKVANIIETGLDVEPTICPVLDLSDVKTEARTINDLFGSNVQLGMSANARAINSMMNSRNQNGGGEDIVLAINKLRKDVRKLDRTAYVINGVTYDDGRDINEVFQSIVRAAKVERRV